MKFLAVFILSLSLIPELVEKLRENSLDLRAVGDLDFQLKKGQIHHYVKRDIRQPLLRRPTIKSISKEARRA